MKCRVCGCTQEHACDGGCWWVRGDICSVCYSAAEALRDWFERANRPSWAALKRELRPPRAKSIRAGGGE
jgi:hypothetical protein